MRPLFKVLLPILVVVLGIATAVGLVRSRKPAKQVEVNVATPLVQVLPVALTDHRFRVMSQGTVEPRTEIAVIPEVSGRVVRISPNMVSGGFFRRGDVLVTLEAVDYRAGVSEARAAVTRAELRLAQEQAQAEVAVEEWERLGQGEPSPLTSRSLFVAEAQASLDAARSALARAEKNLERTAIRAPFTGRVRAESIDVGQFVTAGAPIGRIYAVDYAEISLPLPGDDAAFVDLPLTATSPGAEGPLVTLTKRRGDKVAAWTGRIIRTTGEIDPGTRVLYAVARVEDPYGLADPENARAPLAVGEFVTAAIAGRLVQDVFVVPRSAVRGEDRVCLVDGSGKLRLRSVEILRREGDVAVIASGLRSGERIVVSPLEAPVDGMSVRTVEVSPMGEDAEKGGRS